MRSHFEATYESMRRHNIVLGVVSGAASSEEAWIARDADGRLLRGFGSDQMVWPHAIEKFLEQLENLNDQD